MDGKKTISVRKPSALSVPPDTPFLIVPKKKPFVLYRDTKYYSSMCTHNKILCISYHYVIVCTWTPIRSTRFLPDKLYVHNILQTQTVFFIPYFSIIILCISYFDTKVFHLYKCIQHRSPKIHLNV